MKLYYLPSLSIQNLNWIILLAAGLFEVCFAFCLGKTKDSTGNEMYWWYAGFVFALINSMALLIKATQTLPMGAGYFVWAGSGAMVTVIRQCVAIAINLDLTFKFYQKQLF